MTTLTHHRSPQNQPQARSEHITSTKAHFVGVIRTKVQSIKVVTNDSIGTCSFELYILPFWNFRHRLVRLYVIYIYIYIWTHIYNLQSWQLHPSFFDFEFHTWLWCNAMLSGPWRSVELRSFEVPVYGKKTPNLQQVLLRLFLQPSGWWIGGFFCWRNFRYLKIYCHFFGSRRLRWKSKAHDVWHPFVNFCGEVSNEWVWLSLFVAKSHVRNTRPKTNSEFTPEKNGGSWGTSPLPSSFRAKPGLFSGANWLFKPPPGQGSLNRISTIPQNMANLCKSGKLTSLRIFQHTPGTYPRPQNQQIYVSEFLSFGGERGGLGFDPGVCWGPLRNRGPGG